MKKRSMMLESQQQHILRLIHSGGAQSRTDLAKQLGISKAAISQPVRKLLEQGILLETDSNVSGQGRPSVRLVLPDAQQFFIGVSLLDDAVGLLLVDINGIAYAFEQCPLSRDPNRLVESIGAHIPLLIAAAQITAEQVMSVGLALSGVVDSAGELCLKSTLLDWVDVPIAHMLSDYLAEHHQLALPVYLENDAKSLAIDEHVFGLAKEVNDFTLITLGDGIGSAHFIRGELYRGAHGGAGEIAHTTVEPNNLPCRCGKRGCLDTVSSVLAIREQAFEAHLPADCVADLETLAASGDSAAVRILHRAGNALGLALANIIQINDPQLILIAHAQGGFQGLFATIVKQSMAANVLPSMVGKTEVKPLLFAPHCWPHAAASVAIYHYLYQ